ncbi:protein of unknown function (plasmid) [Cupriavidus taiwanensis]|uniref:Uncharacterized protein n=1 Tax=Cupriavidus taiwanensis TaxID=164546 RepID=A0A375DRF5_9BURK|nr:protein of unknown function [Cupriavidus taiwanensis]SOZ41297.1 protein of unknown function [Cupriavidus taiwanensis]SPC15407.1 hypothetical protein CT19431_MP110171 [Cupriavidus taiwanensis]SPC23578.1 protein of unknown function [Cupriavidus taiwanensis]SPD54853.1 protein of unknown function [Cupriavidus taiwanensis]
MQPYAFDGSLSREFPAQATLTGRTRHF